MPRLSQKCAALDPISAERFKHAGKASGKDLAPGSLMGA